MMLKRLGKAVLLGSGILMAAQVCGVYDTGEIYKMNVVYAAENEPTQNPNYDQYRARSIELINDFFETNLAADSKDVIFKLRVLERKDINATEKELDERMKKMAEETGQPIEMIKHKEETFDEIMCFINLYKEDEHGIPDYVVVFNSDTKEPISISLGRISDETDKMLAEGKGRDAVVASTDKERYLKLIEKYKLGGISKAECYEEENWLMPMIQYRDKQESNKVVKVCIDPATGGLHDLNVIDKK